VERLEEFRLGLMAAGVVDRDMQAAVMLANKVFNRLDGVAEEEIDLLYGRGDFTRGVAVLAVAELFRSTPGA
jgi:hypothetical protein